MDGARTNDEHVRATRRQIPLRERNAAVAEVFLSLFVQLIEEAAD